MFLQTEYLQIFTGSLPTQLPTARLCWDVDISGAHSGMDVSSLFDLHCVLHEILLKGENLVRQMLFNDYESAEVNLFDADTE